MFDRNRLGYSVALLATGVVLGSTFLRPSAAHGSTLTLFGEAKGLEKKDGKTTLNFAFKDETGKVIARRTGEARLQNGSYIAHVSNEGLEVNMPYAMEVSSPGGELAYAGYVSLQGSTPGVADVGHININGTLIAARGVFSSAGTGDVVNASNNGTPVIATSNATSGAFQGGRFESKSDTGTGVRGTASATTGVNYGGLFVSASTEGIGVYGSATATGNTRTYGVKGFSHTDSGVGVTGVVDGTFAIGVYGESRNTNGNAYGIFGSSKSGIGIYGRSDNRYGVWGTTNGSGDGLLGVASNAAGTPRGIRGYSANTNGVGIYGDMNQTTGTGYSIFGNGKMGAAGTKSMVIDDPRDPENYFLKQFCTEGDQPYLVYSGNAVLDNKGTAKVNLPDYWALINKDPRYQLTPIGASMPNLYIASEVKDNQFSIAGGKPGAKVTWTVTAVRNDRWVQRNGAPIREPKLESQKGKYLVPSLYDLPETMRIGYDSDVDNPAIQNAPK